MSAKESTGPLRQLETWMGLSCILGLAFSLACAQAQQITPTSPRSPMPPAADASQPDTGEGSASRQAIASNTPAPESPPGEAADPILARGRDLFIAQCAICHGENGDGQGKFAYLMNPRPRNFLKGNFKLATTQNQIPSDEDLLRTIRRGMPGSAMPPWAHLPRSDLQALVGHVRRIHLDQVQADLRQLVEEGRLSEEQLVTKLNRRTQPGAHLYVPPEPPFDDVRWFSGRRIYLEACASCHGVNGEPVPEAVKFDNEGYPVPPRSFVNGIFKGGSEGHQLYARIVKGLKGTPMPSYEGSYSDDELWDLIHYVQSLAREGAQERAQLRQETIVAPRIKGTLPAGPLDVAWERTRPVFVGMTPLWWTEQRIVGMIVQAVHNGEELAVRMSWLDPTMDDRAVRHDEFRDAVAIQFSLTSDPPFYMGDRSSEGGVNIWLWKADRQTDLASGYQDVDSAFPWRVVDDYPWQSLSDNDLVGLKEWPRSRLTQHNPLFISAWGAGNLVADPEVATSVESLVARGPGTLANKPAGMQFVKGEAEYQRGVWYVQMQRSMDPLWSEDQDERKFKAGDYLPLSFAIWNGSAGDRDGKKNISIWQKLVIE